MKQRKIWVCLCMLLLSVMMLMTGCSQTPYQVNDSEGYSVSVRFDAGHGSFTTNAPVIVDSYDLSQLPINAEGKAELPLIAPDNESRGKDAFTASYGGHFLVGWYAGRQETTDENGNITYTYSDKWDFEADRVTLDTNGSYSASEPVLTLYAAWAPLYSVEFYDRATGQLTGTYSFDPADGLELNVPHWDSETGAVNLYKFPKVNGKTFEAVYYDEAGSQKVTAETITHTGSLNMENAAVDNGTMRLYVDYREGEWYRISTAEQFADNFSLTGCYELLDDLDFSDTIWPTAMMYGSFTGKITGNGHTIRNVSIEQTNNSKPYAGLFGQIADGAALQDVIFDNITLTINGTRVAGTAYGLLCGTASDEAVVSGVSITNSHLLISSGCYFGTEDYTIGLCCGMGQIPIDTAGITCAVTGDAPETIRITVTDTTVTFQKVDPSQAEPTQAAVQTTGPDAAEPSVIEN